MYTSPSHGGSNRDSGNSRRIHRPFGLPYLAMDSRSAGVLIIVLGFAAILVGMLTWMGWMSWFGRLPGDIRMEGERTSVYIPLVSMLILSLVLSVVVSLLRRWL